MLPPSAAGLDTGLLDMLRFDNRFTRELPADPEPGNQRRQVTGAAYSRVRPTPVARPTLIACADEVLALLDLPPAACGAPEFVATFAGNRVLPGMDPHAMVYGGHQFGSWAGQLGDGRAIVLGEIVNRRGEHWALQLKGAGPTPYARTADGLAVLRSSVREFLCSEAMHHLGVPTTRALSLVGTGEEVVRDMFYDGHPRPEPGAVVCRVAPSFLRFGTYQLPAARGDHVLLRALADFTLRTEFPHLGPPSRDAYLAWLREVAIRTAGLIVHWMRVGFVHGVMNTDNMSILGLTIDYGPYGWLEDFDPRWTPNTTDAAGRRYCYGAQPQIAGWNLVQLANALYPLIAPARAGSPAVTGRGAVDTGAVAALEDAVRAYGEAFDRGWRTMLAAKLGLATFTRDDDALVEDLLRVLALVETDVTIFHRRLADVPSAEPPDASDAARLAPLRDAFYAPAALTTAHAAALAAWVRRWAARVRADGTDDATRGARMRRVNPKYVLRNYLAQQAIDRAEQGDYALVRETLEVLRRPYDEQPGREAFAAKRPDWARDRPGCSMLSCSS